jgi:4-hydroxy-tetrahydrodipicolinate synthase
MGFFPLLHRKYGAQWFGGGAWEMWNAPERPYLVEYYRHVVRGETDAARRIYWTLARANAAAMGGNIARGGDIGMYHWPMGKYVSWSVGGNGGAMREPAMRLPPFMMQGRKAALRAMGIEPREPDEEFWVGRVRYGRAPRTTGDT